MSEIADIGRRARVAAARLSTTSAATKNAALAAIADALVARSTEILDANATDVARAREDGINAAIVDRLTLTPARIEGIAAALRELIALKDPIGEMLDGWTVPNGLSISKVRVPLG